MASRMPEVDIQIPEVQEADCEVKPGGVKYEVILEDAKGGHDTIALLNKRKNLGQNSL